MPGHLHSPNRDLVDDVGSVLGKASPIESSSQAPFHRSSSLPPVLAPYHKWLLNFWNFSMVKKRDDYIKLQVFQKCASCSRSYITIMPSINISGHFRLGNRNLCPSERQSVASRVRCTLYTAIIVPEPLPVRWTLYSAVIAPAPSQVQQSLYSKNYSACTLRLHRHVCDARSTRLLYCLHPCECDALRCTFYSEIVVPAPLRVRCTFYLVIVVPAPLRVRCTFYSEIVVPAPLRVRCTFYSEIIVPAPLRVRCTFYSEIVVPAPLRVRCTFDSVIIVPAPLMRCTFDSVIIVPAPLRVRCTFDSVIIVPAPLRVRCTFYSAIVVPAPLRVRCTFYSAIIVPAPLRLGVQQLCSSTHLLTWVTIAASDLRVDYGLLLSCSCQTPAKTMISRVGLVPGTEARPPFAQPRHAAPDSGSYHYRVTGLGFPSQTIRYPSDILDGIICKVCYISRRDSVRVRFSISATLNAPLTNCSLELIYGAGCRAAIDISYLRHLINLSTAITHISADKSSTDVCSVRYQRHAAPLCAAQAAIAGRDLFVPPATAKKELKGWRFPTATAAIKTLEAILKVLSKEGFEHAFKEWQRRWNRAWEATELSLALLEVAFHEPRDVTPRFMVGSLQGGRGWPSRLVGARKNLYLGQGPRTSLL
ncbi:hypothetical protein J6590_063034 [Homalodisca vitripennis]|nr:hypothetical protein J6590_063034 [Homalodisca vitripennis]